MKTCKPLEYLEIIEESPFSTLCTKAELQEMIERVLKMADWKKPSWDNRPYR
jgi:hypothetical protein